MTLIENAKKGKITSIFRTIAKEEGQLPEYIREGISNGTIVIPSNSKNPPRKAVGIGKGLRTKVNANIGTSPDIADIETEIKKARIADKYGSDT
ncbi:phosphomethylpyrimidine synthase ThiC, partial [candidate division WOR-3 bacterium]|nr:phosphomethylpyrimidine synthase ThiC [candidate division WOR-3 bacterium]